MKKKLLATALATAIVLAIAPLALAATHHGGSATKSAKAAKGKPFLAKGAMFSADPTTGTFVVTVTKGSHVVRPYVGTQVTFTLSKHARVLARTVDGSDVAYVRVSLDQVTPGSSVHVNGRLDRSDPSAPVFYAQLVKVVLAPAPSASPSDAPSASPSSSSTTP
jgi:hypothetical protein